MNRRSTLTRAIAVPTNVEKPAAGDGFLCAVVSANNNTTVMCSGKNDVGQLGDGTTANRSYLKEVTDTNKLGSAHQLVAGKSLAYAIAGFGAANLGEGKLYCWGSNQYGQLGTGNNNNSSVPVMVADSGAFTNSSFLGVIAGDNHTCAIKNVSRVNEL